MKARVMKAQDPMLMQAPKVRITVEWLEPCPITGKALEDAVYRGKLLNIQQSRPVLENPDGTIKGADHGKLILTAETNWVGSGAPLRAKD